VKGEYMNQSHDDQQKINRLIELDYTWPHTNSADIDEYKQLVADRISVKARKYIADKIQSSGERSMRKEEVSFFKQFKYSPELRHVRVSKSLT